MHSELIYGNLAARKPAASVTGDTYTFQPFLVGKQYPIALRWLERINGAIRETFKTVRAIRVNVGFDDLRPAANSTKLKVGPGAASEANTTAEISFNESGSDLQTKLNALGEFSTANFAVELDRGSYLIRRADGSQVTIVAVENRFLPVSFVRVRSWQDDIGWVTEIRFIQSPLGFQDTAEPILPPAPYFEGVKDGVDYGNGLVQSEVQNLVRPPAFRGSFFILYKATEMSGAIRTSLFDRTDGPTQYKAALDAILAPQGGVVNVTNPETGKARFEFAGDLKGVDIPLMAVEVPEEGTAPGDLTFILDLNTTEAWSAVRGLAPLEIIKVPFEVEIDVPSNPEDEDSPSLTIPVWSIEIQLRRPITTEGLATAQPVNWLRKPSPKKYLPYNQTQVGIGQLHWESEVFGDGEETHFEFDHNLHVAGLTGLQVIDVTDGRILRPSEYEVFATNDGDSLEFDFVAAPALNSLKVFVSTPQPIEFFINDLQIEMAQVNGLSAIISDITGRIETLEAVLPSTGPGVTSSSSTGLSITLQKYEEILFFRSDTKKPADFLGADGLDSTALDAEEDLLRAPLVPALHDSSVDDVTAVPVSASAESGKVFKNNDSPSLLVTPGRGLPSAYVKQNEFFASDGISFYKVNRYGTSTSYFPEAFERRVLRVAINDQMLVVGRTLDLRFTVQLQLALAACQAQWLFVMEKGTAPSQSSPATTGTNLENVVWDDEPIFSQRLILDSNLQSHGFGVRIRRLSGGFELDQQRYGVWTGNNDAVPASANFLLRGRLIQWDTENAFTDPRGFVFVRLAGEMAADGAVAAGQPKLVIS